MLLHEYLGFSQYFSTAKRPARRALFIAVVLVVLNQLCGCYILLNYTTSFFAEAGSNLTPIESSMVINMVMLAAHIITIFLVDRAGRKILFCSSAIEAALGLFVLGIHSLYKEQWPELAWVPVIALSFVVFTASLGLLSLPIIINIDILPPKVKRIQIEYSAN